MGNSPSSGSRSSPFRGSQKPNVLLVKANINGDHHVSKYQHYEPGRCLQCFESLRWKLNMSLTYRPFNYLSLCRMPGEIHQFLYRMTVAELIFWGTAITLIGIFPFPMWFESVRNTKWDEMIKWRPDLVFDWSLGPDTKFGLPTSICFVVTWIFALRHSVAQILFGISFERAASIHKHCGRLSLLMSFFHFWEYKDFAWLKGQCLTGFIAFCAAFLLILTSLEIFRRKIWTIFLKLHWIFFITFLVAAFLHHARYMWIAVAFQALDILIRCHSIWGKPVDLMDVRLLPCNVIRIEFNKEDFQFSAGQYVFICIPAIDMTQWHPFSISSPPHQDESVLLHVRVLGDWTRKLYKLIALKYEQHNLKKSMGGAAGMNSRGTAHFDWNEALTIYVEGPYGDLQIPLHEYQSIIMISGGIGITPLQSMFNEMVYNISQNISPNYLDHREEFHDLIQRIHFVWSVREPSMVREFGKRHWAGIQYKNQYPYGAYKKILEAMDKEAGIDDEESLPNFYSPDLLLVQQGTKMVQKTKVITQYHLTRCDEQKQRMFANQYRLLKFGRPNIEKIIKSAINDWNEMNVDGRWSGKGQHHRGEEGVEKGCCLKGTKGKGICILCCGPPSMVKSVKKYASQYDIDCHFEIFEL